MLFPSGNPFKCHEEVLYLQPLIPPKRFDISPPLSKGCSEGLGAFWFFFKPSVLSVSHRGDQPPQDGNPGDGTYPSPRFTQLWTCLGPNTGSGGQVRPSRPVPCQPAHFPHSGWIWLVGPYRTYEIPPAFRDGVHTYGQPASGQSLLEY